MQLTVEVLRIQQRRLHRARRIAHHADRVRDIGIEHARYRALVPLEAFGDGVERFLAVTMHHGFKASRAFALARKLYDRAESVRQGVA